MTVSFRAAAAAAIVAGTSTAVAAQSVDFEDLVATTTYTNGMVFNSSGVAITVADFFFLPVGAPFTGGFARVDSANNAGGTGLDVNTNNVNLDFDFGDVVTELSFLYGDFGGNTNLSVNGSLVSIDDLVSLDGSVLAGVAISAPATVGGNGAVTLTGSINQFSVGGQEFWIDAIEFTLIPTPGALALAPLALFACGRRRR